MPATDTLPLYLIVMLSDRASRMHAYLWHQIRNGWLFFDRDTRSGLRRLGWEPPRPARRPRRDGRAEAILDNASGEDFLYFHHEMIAALNDRLAGDPTCPRVQGWDRIPPPGDAEYPVPPAWDTGDSGLTEYLRQVKSDAAYDDQLAAWEARYTDPARLRAMSLGELGARIEFTIHNQMLMRWCEEPHETGIRPDETNHPDAVGPEWDDPAYDWLGDPYASHVNPLFWKIHGWIDGRVADWAKAHGVAGLIPWCGTWVGRMPTHPVPHSVSAALARRAFAAGRDSGHADLPEMIHAARLVAGSGHVSRFSDDVVIPG